MNRTSVLVGTLITLLASTAATAAVDAPEAQAFLADVQGEVWIFPSKSNARQQAALGQPLEDRDRVAATADGRAILFWLDGRILSIEGGRDAIVGDELEGALSLRLPTDILGTVASGLQHWGEWSPLPSGKPQPAQPRGKFETLSPRSELIVEHRPTFFWTGGWKRLRLKVRGGQEQMYQTWMAPEGSTLRYPVWAIPLEPGGTYEWWMKEIRTRTPVTATVMFHVASEEVILKTESFENALAEAELVLGSPNTVNLLRCAYYGEIGAWSRLLLAAEYLPVDGIRPAIVRRARQVSRRRMGLDRDAAVYLLTLMVWKELEI